MAPKPESRILPADFAYVRELLRSEAAIQLDEGKEWLVEARLGPLAVQHAGGSLTAFIGQLRSNPASSLQRSAVEAIVNNETCFFRDYAAFQMLREQVVPDLVKRRASEKTLRIWCAACSSGQEAYSVAMVLREHSPSLSDWRFRILATDVSRQAIRRAAEATYNQAEINRGLPASLLVKYFQQQGTRWRLKDDIRRMVDLREVQLARPFPPLETMDLILLRNVLIYFDAATKCAVLRRVHDQLAHDGYLLLGGAETTVHLETSFQPVSLGRSVAYRKATFRANGLAAAQQASIGSRQIGALLAPAFPARTNNHRVARVRR